MDERAPGGARRPSRGFIVCLWVIAVLFAMGWWFAPGNVQTRNMGRVARYVDSVRPLAADRAEFGRIRWIVYTADDGCLLVDGEVDSVAILAELRALVSAHPCPRPVRWNVDVVTPQERAEREAWEREEAARKAPPR